MNLIFRNTDGYLEWILMDGKKTVVSDITWVGYDFWEKQHINNNKLSQYIQSEIVKPHIVLNKTEMTGFIYCTISPELFNDAKNTLSSATGSIMIMNLFEKQDHVITMQDIPRNDHNTKIKKQILHIAKTLFELQQFQSSTWYINASSKIESLKKEYEKSCNEMMYIDSLYFWDITSIDQIQLHNYGLIKIFGVKSN